MPKGGNTTGSYIRLANAVSTLAPWANEEWRALSYSVSHGQVEVSSKGRVRLVLVLPLTGSPNNLGYWRVKIGKKTIPIHKLVAEAFLGPRPLGKVINHKDGVKAHNQHDNLEYVTPSENSRHARTLHPWKNHGRGRALTDVQVREIRDRFANGQSFSALATIYGVSYPTIVRAIKHQTYEAIACR